VSERELTLAKEGLEAWRQGDFGSIESMLDPGATWRASEPGVWDCDNRADILRTLRERHEEGFARSEVELLDGGPDAVIVVAHPRVIGGEDWPEETATVISFRDAKIVAMQDYPTRDEAVAAVS
jgi:ketosteroid isomerase-like protein